MTGSGTRRRPLKKNGKLPPPWHAPCCPAPAATAVPAHLLRPAPAKQGGVGAHRRCGAPGCPAPLHVGREPSAGISCRSPAHGAAFAVAAASWARPASLCVTCCSTLATCEQVVPAAPARPHLPAHQPARRRAAPQGPPRSQGGRGSCRGPGAQEQKVQRQPARGGYRQLQANTSSARLHTPCTLARRQPCSQRQCEQQALPQPSPNSLSLPHPAAASSAARGEAAQGWPPPPLWLPSAGASHSTATMQGEAQGHVGFIPLGTDTSMSVCCMTGGRNMSGGGSPAACVAQRARQQALGAADTPQAQPTGSGIPTHPPAVNCRSTWRRPIRHPISTGSINQQAAGA